MLTSVRRVTLALLGAGLAVTMAAGTALAAGHVSTSAAGSVTVSGLDLHDGTIVTSGSTLEMYGTRYGCGFYWEKTSPWCGFGVSSAAAVTGPWSTPKLLFSTATRIEATGWAKDNGKTWSQMCGGGGGGCFNPRMLHTPNGRWLLWFNAPDDKGRGANPYWVMTCSGPAGPCGSPHKPAIYSACRLGGDFSLAVQAAVGYLICSDGGTRITDVEPLATGMTDGANKDILVPGAIGEAPGVYHSGAGYVLTLSTPQCGYCSGTAAASPGARAVQTGYATAASLSGPWSYKGVLSEVTCTGQPRSASSLLGKAYEWVDEWNGSHTETAAPILLVPFTEDPWSCHA